MRDNIKKGIFRIYIIIWGLWFLMGFSDFFYDGQIQVTEGQVKEFIILAIVLPTAILFATKWIVKGFENK
jgi:hypothetical protein